MSLSFNRPKNFFLEKKFFQHFFSVKKKTKKNTSDDFFPLHIITFVCIEEMIPHLNTIRDGPTSYLLTYQVIWNFIIGPVHTAGNNRVSWS